MLCINVGRLCPGCGGALKCMRLLVDCLNGGLVGSKAISLAIFGKTGARPAPVALLGLLALAALSLPACRSAKPILPKKPVPTGTLQMHFVNKVRGQVDLTIDGVRVPVRRKTKKAQVLTIAGLSEGTHRYHISGWVEVFGPDLGEVEIGSEGGVFQVHFAQRLRTTIYKGREEAAPPAEGIAGVTAVLE